jgi:hypothetical protein
MALTRGPAAHATAVWPWVGAMPCVNQVMTPAFPTGRARQYPQPDCISAVPQLRGSSPRAVTTAVSPCWPRNAHPRRAVMRRIPRRLGRRHGGGIQPKDAT